MGVEDLPAFVQSRAADKGLLLGGEITDPEGWIVPRPPSATAIVRLMGGNYAPMSPLLGEALRTWIKETDDFSHNWFITGRDSLLALRMEEWRRTGVSRERGTMNA